MKNARRICLAANTATCALSVALVAGDGAVLYRFETPETRDQGNILFSRIGEGLAQNGLTYADINLLAAVTGPGSFTGIRIGLAAMRGLGLAAGIPVAGVNSFDLYAAETDDTTLNIVAVESWREEIYFRAAFGDGRVVVPPVNESAEDFINRPEIAAEIAAGRDVILSGDAAARVREHFPRARVAEDMPDAVRVARLALTNPAPAAPFYVRDADISTPKTVAG